MDTENTHIPQRILIISQVYYPSISPRAFRTTELATELVRQGNDVTVMIPDLDVNEYDEYSRQTGVKFKSLGNKKYKRITGSSFIERATSRLLQLLLEFPDIQLIPLIKRALKHEKGYNLLISVAVPHPIHWGVAAVIKKNKQLCKTWIADCGDPYMGCRTDTFKKLFYFKYVEKNWCRKCDNIVVPVDEMIADFYPEFHDKIALIPQGFRLDNPETYKNNNPVSTFMYAGTLATHYRNPLPFIALLAELGIDFKFIVYSQTDILNKYINQFNGRLEVRKPIPRSELLKEMCQMDFLVNFENIMSETSTGKNSSAIKTDKQQISGQYSMPSKLIDYIIAGRPVLSIGEKPDKSIVLQFMKGNYTNQMILQDKSNYDIQIIARKFLNLQKRL